MKKQTSIDFSYALKRANERIDEDFYNYPCLDDCNIFNWLTEMKLEPLLDGKPSLEYLMKQVCDSGFSHEHKIVILEAISCDVSLIADELGFIKIKQDPVTMSISHQVPTELTKEGFESLDWKNFEGSNVTEEDQPAIQISNSDNYVNAISTFTDGVVSTLTDMSDHVVHGKCRDVIIGCMTPSIKKIDNNSGINEDHKKELSQVFDVAKKTEHEFDPDMSVKYSLKRNEFYIETNDDRGHWTPLRKQDVLFMAKKMGIIE